MKVNRSARSKIAKEIEKLKEFGISLNNHHIRKISSTPLWEVRILGKDNVRIICVTVIEKRVVILNIFKKKANKTPISEINISLKRYKELTNDI